MVMNITRTCKWNSIFCEHHCNLQHPMFTLIDFFSFPFVVSKLRRLVWIAQFKYNLIIVERMETFLYMHIKMRKLHVQTDAKTQYTFAVCESECRCMDASDMAIAQLFYLITKLLANKMSIIKCCKCLNKQSWKTLMWLCRVGSDSIRCTSTEWKRAAKRTQSDNGFVIVWLTHFYWISKCKIQMHHHFIRCLYAKMQCK